METETETPTCPSCKADLLDADDVRDGIECSECYTNDDCPARCHDEHDAPEPDYGGTWECPTTGEAFAYEGPDGNYFRGDWSSDRYGNGSTLLDGQWMIDPHEYDYCRCESCEEWVYTDCAEYSERDGYVYCSDCYRDERRNSGAGMEPVIGFCVVCDRRAHVVAWNSTTEETYCADHAVTTSDTERIAA